MGLFLLPLCCPGNYGIVLYRIVNKRNSLKAVTLTSNGFFYLIEYILNVYLSMQKAMLYTEAEATNLKIISGVYLLKDFFDPENYQKIKNTEWSSALGRWVTGDVLLIGKFKVASLWFEDGSVWDTNVGWRGDDHTDAEFVNRIYNQLKDAKEKADHV